MFEVPNQEKKENKEIESNEMETCKHCGGLGSHDVAFGMGDVVCLSLIHI